MTNQRKTALEYADDYDYEDYASNLGGENPYTAYAREKNSEKDKVTATAEDYRDTLVLQKDRYRKEKPYVSKMGYRRFADGYRHGDQRAEGTFVQSGGYGGGGHSGGHGGGCGTSYSVPLDSLCALLALAAAVAVAAAAAVALFLALQGKRKKRSLGRTIHDFEEFNILKGKQMAFHIYVNLC